MASKRKLPLVPVDYNGDLVHYQRGSAGRPFTTVVWETDADGNYVRDADGKAIRHTFPGSWVEAWYFEDVLHIADYNKSGSHASFTLKSESGKIYHMYMNDMLDLIKRGEIHQGMTAGTWTFQRKGSALGIRLATEQELEDLTKEALA